MTRFDNAANAEAALQNSGGLGPGYTRPSTVTLFISGRMRGENCFQTRVLAQKCLCRNDYATQSVFNTASKHVSSAFNGVTVPWVAGPGSTQALESRSASPPFAR